MIQKNAFKNNRDQQIVLNNLQGTRKIAKNLNILHREI